MKLLRGTAAVLVALSLTALTACGGDDTETKAGSTPATTAATTAASPAAAVSSAPVAAGGAGDVKVCNDANAAGEAMKKNLIKSMQAAGADEKAMTAAMQKVMTDFVTSLTTVAGDDSGPAATAVKQVATEAAKVAASADPATASDDPGFEQSFKGLVSACKTVGVTIKE